MLRAEQLNLTVPGKTLCRDLTLELAAGQCWGILGKNGSGKTTLLHALSGLIQPDSGHVLLDGQALKRLPRRQLARRMGTLLQEETSGFSGSVLDYVLLGRFPHGTGMALASNDVDVVRQALRATGLTQAEQQSLATLSGGERQRARIALLLAQEPDLYFLDEPLQHLDLPHQLDMMRLFRRLAREQSKTVVMVLHDVSWAKHYCSHIILIHDKGKILHGTNEQMITVESMKSLYQCGFQTFSTSDGNYFLPTLE